MPQIKRLTDARKNDERLFLFNGYFAVLRAEMDLGSHAVLLSEEMSINLRIFMNLHFLFTKSQ